MAGSKYLYNIVWTFLLFSIVSSAKLNVPRVLLPLFKQFQTNFTLEVHDSGCYKWTSSRSDIVQVIPLELDKYHSCSLKAVVSAVTKEPIRNTVIVLAEEVDTGFVLRCDVIVDVIDSLKIVTTTRELFMEEAPEMFEVRAEDSQGNKFTTLEGVQFNWSIENIAQLSSAKEVLRFISFIDSPYETPENIERFDSIGLQGHKVLIEGVKTGTSKVSVKLPHPEYADVEHIDVLLTVLANLLLDPPDTHILAGDTVKFRLLQMQHGRLEEVPLPSAQYVLDIEDSEVAMLDRSVSMVRGVQVGQTRVLLRDTHSEGTIKLPTATVVVTEPAYLRLVLLPHNNWAVLVDEPCSIWVQVFDRNNHRIHVGDAVTVRTIMNEDYFRVYSMTRNGTFIEGTTTKVGTVPVTASLESVRAIGGKEIKLKPSISTQADMLIYPKLTVSPSHVLVPWDSSISKYEIELTATGGDGTYSWRSNDLSVLSVSQTGIVRCSGLGITNVAVSMTRNLFIKALAEVEVLPPSHLEIVKHVVEAPILKPIILHIALFADKEDEHGNLKRVHFTHCNHIQFKVELSNDNFAQNTTDRSKPIGNACTTVTVFGNVYGTSTVKVSFKLKNLSLEASTEVAAFNPLEVVHPNKKTTVLSVGSSRHVVWKGGPRVWLGRSAEHVRSITTSSSTITVEEISISDQTEFYVYSVLCRGLGEFSVTLNIKNAAGNGQLKYTQSTSSVKVICAKPRTISIAVERPPNASCPYSSDSSPIIALSYEHIKLLVKIFDSEDRVFDNATSLNVNWIMSSKTLGSVLFDGRVILEETKENNYIIPNQHYQIVEPQNKTGSLIVDAVVANYRERLLSELNIEPEKPAFWIENDSGKKVKPTIRTSLTFVLVNGSIVTPDKATVFNHPNNKVVFKVSQGSGFYNFYQSSMEIADVKYKENSQTIEVFPRSDGLLQLTVTDLCLSYKSPIVEIQVLKVGSLQVEMLERVQKGNTITATMWLYDSVDNSLDIADSELLELQPHVESQIISVSRVASDSVDGHVNFLITGVELGNTFVTFSSGYGDREIRSLRLPIEVFPPLSLVPQHITLPVGAVFQVTPTGGPQQDFSMEYVSTDNSIARVNPSGLIEAHKVGDVIVTGMAVSQLRTGNNKVVYSKDEVNVHVIQLEGVKIHSPLVKIKVGCQMPVWVFGVPEKLSPMVLGSMDPPLVFKWTTSTTDIVELQDIFYSTGVEVLDTDRLSMRILAIKAGQVTIHLNVTSRTGKYGEFSDQLQLEVFEELAVIHPNAISDSRLIMAPFSRLRLRTNKDSVSEVKYSVIGSPEPSYNLLQTALSNEVPVVAVNRGGVVTSHGALGTAWVVVSSVEDYGLKQTLPVNIEVKPVHYIMLNVNTKLHLGPTVVSALPRGLDLEFIVSYHDNTGVAFAATRTDIRTLLNRADSIKVVRGEVNGTLVSKLTSYGSSVLKIWDDSTPTRCQDYVKLRVDHLITPSKGEMTVGDIASYCMPLTPGDWTTTAPSVLWMDTHSGLATALSPGQATVKYTLTSTSSTVTTSTQVTILPIHSIVFLPLEGRNLTDCGTFSVPLVLLNEKEGPSKTSNLVTDGSPCPYPTRYNPPHTQLPFICEIRFNSPMAPVDIHQVFNIQPSFSVKTGLYSCLFESLNSPSVNTSVLTSNVTLRAISENLVSEPLVVPFLPSVFLPAQELLLSDKQTVTTLTVIGVPVVLSQVQVIPSVGTYLILGEGIRSEVNRLFYKVSLVAMPSGDQDISLYVYSPLTGQNVTVPVRINTRSERLAAPCLAHPSSPWFQYIMDILPMIASILVILFVIWYSNVISLVQASYPSSMAGTSSVMTPQVYHNSTPETRAYTYRQPFSDMEPVYGDPSLSHSPGLSRRNRR